MNIIGWTAYYTGPRIFNSSTNTWANLPKSGMLLVTLFFNEKNSDGNPYKEILSGNRRYFQAIGSSGNIFIKPTLWKENKILDTYNTSTELIKEGIWDDDETMRMITKKALATKHWVE